jgi:hypothetical protein
VRFCAAYALEHCADDLAYFENVKGFYILLTVTKVSVIRSDLSLLFLPLTGLSPGREGSEGQTAECGGQVHDTPASGYDYPVLALLFATEIAQYVPSSSVCPDSLPLSPQATSPRLRTQQQWSSCRKKSKREKSPLKGLSPCQTVYSFL